MIFLNSRWCTFKKCHECRKYCYCVSRTTKKWENRESLTKNEKMGEEGKLENFAYWAGHKEIRIRRWNNYPLVLISVFETGALSCTKCRTCVPGLGIVPSSLCVSGSTVDTVVCCSSSNSTGCDNGSTSSYFSSLSTGAISGIAIAAIAVTASMMFRVWKHFPFHHFQINEAKWWYLCRCSVAEGRNQRYSWFTLASCLPPRIL